MKVLDFLLSLRERDIQVWADGDRLRCNAPLGRLTPELRKELQQRKSQILNFLRSAGSLARQQPGIVPLQPHGANIPVFAVAGHNGDVFCFRALAHHLGAAQPFFGLQPPGLDGSRVPLTRVEELAGYFAGQIRAGHGAGPYVIAGYCAGGTVALELAQQLLRSGAEIPALTLFGSPFPTSYRLMPRLSQRLRQAAARFARHMRALPRLPPPEQLTYVAEKWRNFRAERAAEKRSSDPVLVWRDKVARATLGAIRRYVPQPFPGRLHLFWPSPNWQYVSDALVQWPRLARDAEKHFGPDGSDGSNMLREPYAARYAELFRGAVQGIQSRKLRASRERAASSLWHAQSLEAISNQNT